MRSSRMGAWRVRRLGMLKTIVIIALGAVSASAWGQSTRVLVPDRYMVPQGASVALGVRSDGEAIAWPEEEMRHYFVRSTGRQSNRDSVAPEADGSVRWSLTRPGVSVIGMDLDARTETVTGAGLLAFLDEHVGEEAARPKVAAEAEVEIRRVESLKTLVRVGEGGPGAVATDKTGQRVEIRVLNDPTRLKVGSDLSVRVYANYQGVPGGLVTARHVATGEVVREVVDRESIGDLRIDAPGEWHVAFHHLEAPGEEEDAWMLYSSTLTFRVPAEEER